MKTISFSLAISLMIIAAIIGLAAGYYISPEYRQSMYVKEEMNLGKADRFVDLRYINKMIAHHRGAILLAEKIADIAQHSEIKDLAVEIQKNEPMLIKELYDWKKTWYKDNRKISDPIVANFGSADEKVDLRFLNALIAHHEAGIEMTKEIRTKSNRKEILDNADAVENFLSNGLIMLKSWREKWFSVK
ncbi:MAG: DUF305 domain-containing protein [Patescibacteria group bacterium]|nr:DUF305 domain-containing protein [Patescibacteria group bacterium]